MDIYKTLDDRLQKDKKKALIAFAKTKGMYYHEYVSFRLTEVTARQLRSEMFEAGILMPPNINTLRSVKIRADMAIKTIKSKEKICTKCNHRPVGEGLWIRCRVCRAEDIQMANKHDIDEAPLRTVHAIY